MRHANWNQNNINRFWMGCRVPSAGLTCWFGIHAHFSLYHKQNIITASAPQLISTEPPSSGNNSTKVTREVETQRGRYASFQPAAALFFLCADMTQTLYKGKKHDFLLLVQQSGWSMLSLLHIPAGPRPLKCTFYRPQFNRLCTPERRCEWTWRTEISALQFTIYFSLWTPGKSATAW